MAKHTKRARQRQRAMAVRGRREDKVTAAGLKGDDGEACREARSGGEGPWLCAGGERVR